MVSAPDNDPRVDDLRQRLRALGYLDAGVDRFVLGAARDARAPWVIALYASLRIGGIAAILLGPATAIGLSARLPSLVTGPRDALIIALYFGVFFGLAIAGTAFVTSLLVAWVPRSGSVVFTRQGSLLSRLAGGLVTLGCLIYLTLWWQTVLAGVGWSSPVWTASALALAAAISLLLGHAVTVGSSAVLMASAGRRGIPPAVAASSRPSAFQRWRARLAVGLVAFGGAALLLTWSDRTASAIEAPPPLTVVPNGMRVKVIAIDGLDPGYFDDSADFPQRLGNALRHAATIRFANEGERSGEYDPARAWTTVATGQPPEIHGVQSLETRRLAGLQGSVATAEASTVARALRGATDLVRLTRPSVASGQERRAKTFWEVAASAGLNTVVINWWATWPAVDGAGAVLSDRATVRLDQGGPLDAEIAPASLYDSLRQRWPALKERARALAVAALRRTGSSPVDEILARSAELDALQILLLSEIATPKTDLSVVYLPGLDIARYAIREHAKQTGDISLADTNYDSSALTMTYVSALDQLLVPVLTPAPDEIVMVLTQPGRVPRGTLESPSSERGRLAARGQNVSLDLEVFGDAMDITPTTLHALGVPISRDLGGQANVLFTKDFNARYPPRFVATYGPPAAHPAARSGQPLDQETIDRLRSLGYLK